MKTHASHRIAFAFLPAGLLLCASCGTPEETPLAAAPAPAGERTSAAAVEAGVPGGIFVETLEVTAKVKSIDQEKREAVLVTADGKETKYKAPPEAVNFDQVHAGDEVKATVIQEIVVAVREKGAAKSDGAGGLVALSPKGSKPGAVMVESIEVTTKVKSVDLEKHQAVLEFPDGTTRTVNVRSDVKLSAADVGREVVIQATQAIAIKVAKP